ncbi:unnamed protein product [Closterium sp. NIES-64]|nr:unnamed protein product [Closterium sp. NIES-64]
MVQLPLFSRVPCCPSSETTWGSCTGAEFGGAFDAAFKFWSIRGPIADRSHVAHTTLGNYMWFFANDSLALVFHTLCCPSSRELVGQMHGRKFGASFDAAFKFWSIRSPIADRSHLTLHTPRLATTCGSLPMTRQHWAFEWESRTPIPRVGVHIPHTHEFRNASGPAAGPPQRLVKTYVDLTGTYAHEGLCNAFPEGELAHCEGRVEGAGTDLEELLSLYDEAYRPLWPARVDLVVRSYVSDNFFLTAFLFASIEQIGQLHCQIYYEKNVLDLPGKILQQWSYLWADNYTTAPYIAIIDDDVIFNLKATPGLLFTRHDRRLAVRDWQQGHAVTPGLLFNLTNGKPYVIGSKNTQSDNWKPSSYYFVGRYHANYMVQLPFVFPRSVLPEFRRRAAKRHKKDFNAAVKYFADHGPSFAK